MAIHYWVGDGFIDMRQLESLSAQGALQELAKGKEKVEHRRGVISRKALADAAEPFTPIGLGKPLSIRMHTVYVGKLPGWGRKDLLVVSGVKAAETWEVSGRAVNLIQSRVGDHEFGEFSAFRQSCPIVYYSTAVTDYNLTASFEVVPDSFKQETVEKVGGLFTLAAGLPVFAPAATFLLAGSSLIKMFSDLGRVFLEKGPILSHTFNLNFGVGGLPLFHQGFYVVTNQSISVDFDGYAPTLHDGTVKLTRGGKVYDGDHPYVILGVDGKPEPPLENYRPHLASAALLEKFYPKEDGIGVAIDKLGDAMQLYNDFSFRTKAEDLKKKLEKMNSTDSQYAGLKDLFEAYRKNINQEELKVSSIG